MAMHAHNSCLGLVFSGQYTYPVLGSPYLVHLCWCVISHYTFIKLLYMQLQADMIHS